MDINYQLPQIQRFPGWSEYTRQASLQALAPPPALSNSAMNAVNQQKLNLFKQYLTQQNKNLLLGQAVSSLTGQLSNQVSEGVFGTDTELGQAMGNLFSTGINTAGDQVVNNIFKGESLMDGMGQSVGSSLAGAGAGIAANYIGKGISSLGGNSKLSRGLGAGFAAGAGTLGGGALSNIINGERAFGDIADSFKAIKTFNQAKNLAKGSPEALEALKASKLGTLNLVGLGASIVGTGLQAAFGPSKEYGGTYGNITKGMDTAYDLIQGAAGFIPGVGTAVSGLMALNKGLSNVFGSTSGMTRQDAILGSAFMPATVKWLNMAGAKTTDKFRNQSWLNQERTNTFMQNGFGDLGEKFDRARRESGKTYGTFSRHAYNKAQGNLNFANDAFNRILDMADDEEVRRIRSEYMTSINNQRYAQDITGGFRPLYRGKEGMKIPKINHNFGQRLLSGAALIDNKQMILSAQSGNKIFATNSRGDSYYVSPSAIGASELNVTTPEVFVAADPDDVARGNAQRWWKEHSNVHNEKTNHNIGMRLLSAAALIDNKQMILSAQSGNKIFATNSRGDSYYLSPSALTSSEVNVTVPETFITANPDDVARGNALRWWKEHSNVYGEKGLEQVSPEFDVIGLAPLVKPIVNRGFRWVFNKAGLLVKVPVLETSIVNNLTSHVQGEEAVKMFKEYGGTPIPEGSINGEQLRKYVMEARERYGLIGNNNITDEEIAQALYKHSKELGGNTAAVNAQGEPLLLFRGDTQRYTLLKERMSPEELAKKSGTMDNSLGNLFLGEFPNSYRGVDRYIGTWRNFNGDSKLVGSGTGSKVVWDGKTASEIEGYPYLGPLAGGGYKLYSQPHRYGNIDVYKLPASMMESGVNDLNAFIVRTPQMRNASSEISVLNDDWMLQGAKDSHFMSKNYKYNPKTYSMENVKTGESLGEITTESAPESRIAMGDHYKELLKEAEQKQLGLLKSEANSPLRDEHSQYSYFALPNFNIRGAKHLLPYDLRIPRDWSNPNIYKAVTPYIIGGSTAATLYNINK